MEALALAAGLGRDAVHAQLAAGLDVVLHLERDRGGRRRWSSLAVALRRGAHTEVVEALGRDPRTGAPARGPAYDLLADRLGPWLSEARC
jgi:pilus assembly protein CpaF